LVIEEGDCAEAGNGWKSESAEDSFLIFEGAVKRLKDVRTQIWNSGREMEDALSFTGNLLTLTLSFQLLQTHNDYGEFSELLTC
jgi:hypothetical protein